MDEANRMQVTDSCRDREQEAGDFSLGRRKRPVFQRFHHVPRAAISFAKSKETRKCRMLVLRKQFRLVPESGGYRFIACGIPICSPYAHLERRRRAKRGMDYSINFAATSAS